MKWHRGVCVDALNPGGRPGLWSLRQLKVDSIRMVAFDKPEFYRYAGLLDRGGIAQAIVLTSGSFTDGEPLGDQAAAYAGKVKPFAHVVGNEWNIPGDASWPRGDDAFVAVWNEIAPAIRSVDGDARLYVGGMHSEPPSLSNLQDRIQRVWPQLSPEPDGIDIHPYMETYQEADALLQAFRDLFPEKDICVLEWNDSDLPGLRRFEYSLEQLTEHSAFFCYSDLMVPPYGLMDASGRRKEGWYAYRDAIGATAPPVPPLVEPVIELVQGNVAGTFAAQPQGVILHGTRSGQQGYSTEQEYRATVNYVGGGAAGLGWSITVGDGVYCAHMSPMHWGWNARGASRRFLAAELAQPTSDHPISDSQVSAFCWWFLNIARVAWPNLPAYFPTHAELPEGIIDGKSDVYPRGDGRADELRGRIMTILGE